jgi:hypothetical protein
MGNPTPNDLPENLRLPEQVIEPVRLIYCWGMAVSGVAKYDADYFWFSFYCGKADYSAFYYLLYPIPATEVDALLAWFARYEARLAKDGVSGVLHTTIELENEFRAWRGAQGDYSSRPWKHWFSTAENSRFWLPTENA